MKRKFIPRKYDLIIFDCDGTLVDSEPVTNKLISTMIGEKGIEFTTQQCIEEFAGKTITAITDFVESKIGEIDKIAFESDYRRRCLKIFDDELMPIPGAIDLLKSTDVPYCIASNGPKQKMDVTLQVCGITNMVQRDAIFSAYDVQKWKPEPHLFLHAADQMKSKPNRCVVIEDSLSGVQAAINARMDVLVYNAHNDPKTRIDGVPNFTNMTDLQYHLYHCGVTSSPE